MSDGIEKRGESYATAVVAVIMLAFLALVAVSAESLIRYLGRELTSMAVLFVAVFVVEGLRRLYHRLKWRRIAQLRSSPQP